MAAGPLADILFTTHGSIGQVCYLGPPVGLKRLLFLVVLAFAMSLGLASSAPAGNFDEPRMGCSGEGPAVCPTGTEGVPYSMPIELVGDEDEGCATYGVTSGSFPPGLSVNTDGARVEGTPTQAGSYRFFLTVFLNKTAQCEATCGAKCASDDEFIININPGLAKLTIGPESTTPGTTGAPYSLQMTATVADPKTWTINSGTLPPGLAIDAATGLISGTPTAAGQFDFQVLARMNADTRTDTKALGIVVRDPLGVLGTDPFSPARRATGEVGVPFDALLAATGGNGTYTWSLTSGLLPPGLLIADGAISGTPTTAGVYPFTAMVTDTEGRVANYPGRILVAQKLAVSTLLLRRAKQGFYYQAKLNTSGGVLPRTWRIARGPLPRGVRFDRSAGLLYGIPTRPGRFRVTFEATDALGVKAKKTLSIFVKPKPKPKPKKRPKTG
jgi:large repetitive protein